MKQVHVLKLTYNISFDDADDGDCYAGEGCRVLSVHEDRAVAAAIAAEFNPVWASAEKERIVFPVQKFSKMLKKKFGLVPNDFSEGYDFQLVVETFDVE